MALHILQVTLGSGATRIISTRKPIHDVQFQNNAAHVIRIGDSTVTATTGIALGAVGSGGAGTGGSAYFGPYPQYPSNLSEYWAFGTAADVLD
jgi:hypothetical protein